jgi:hypothetical protein
VPTEPEIAKWTHVLTANSSMLVTIIIIVHRNMKIIKKEIRPNMMSKIIRSIKAINSTTTIIRSTAVVETTKAGITRM